MRYQRQRQGNRQGNRNRNRRATWRIGGNGQKKQQWGGPQGDRLRQKPRDTLVSRPGAAPNRAPVAPPKAPSFQPKLAGPDSTYNSAIAGAKSELDKGLAQVVSQKGEVEADFGIKDPSNPFNRAESLKRLYLSKQRGSSAGLAAEGQLYSGVHERAMSRVRRDEEQAKGDLYKAYKESLGQVSDTETGIKNQYTADTDEAFKEWLERRPDATGPAEEEKPAAPAPAASPVVGAKPALTAEQKQVPIVNKAVAQAVKREQKKVRKAEKRFRKHKRQNPKAKRRLHATFGKVKTGGRARDRLS